MNDKQKEAFERLEVIAQRKEAVEFIRDDEAFDYAAKGMRCVVLSAEVVHDDEVDVVFELRVDFQPFDEYNKMFETHDFYDENRVPCKTAREIGVYEPQTSIFVNESFDNLIRPVNTTHTLYEEYKATCTDVSYLVWLETLVIRLREKA